MLSSVQTPLIQVLLIEDNEDDYVFTKTLLASVEAPRFQLDWFSSFATAKAAIARVHYDVCLIDYRLGEGCTGLDVLQALVNQGFHAPIILLTGGGDRTIDLEAMHLGAVDFLYKDELSAGLLERSLRYAIQSKKAEDAALYLAQEAADRQQQYHALVNSIDGILWEADPGTGEYTFLSQRLERLLGYGIDCWLGDPGFWQSCIYQEDRAAVLQFCRQVGPGQQHRELEFRVVAADGRVVWLRNLVTAVHDQQGAWQLRGVMVDITAQKLAETALGESEARYRAIVEQSIECIYLIDVVNHRILEANPSAQRLLGYSLEELQTLTLYDILEQERSALHRQIQGILADGNPYVGQGQHRCKDGSLVDISASISLITYHQQRVLSVIAQDLTYQQRVEAAQQQIAELERLSQLKDDFLSTISHELRTPISNMRLATQLLEHTLQRQGFLDPDENHTRRYLDILQEEIQREISLIDDLLNLTRLDAETEPLLLTKLDLSPWIFHLVEAFEARIQLQRQVLSLQVPPQLPALTTDLTSFKRILSELLTNACKYTPAGERITLAVQILESELLAQPAVQIRVSNSGVEIAPQEYDRVFEKFYRIPKEDPWRYSGTGLGLALVKKLVQRLGGCIRLESSQGQVHFILELPLGQPLP